MHENNENQKTLMEAFRKALVSILASDLCLSFHLEILSATTKLLQLCPTLWPHEL